MVKIPDDDDEFYDDDLEEEEFDPEGISDESTWEEQKHWGRFIAPLTGLPPGVPPPVTPVKSKSEPPIQPQQRLKLGWRRKLKKRTLSEIHSRGRERPISDEQRIAAAVEAKWRRTKIRRPYLKRQYKTDWIREILDSDPHKKSTNFKIKENLTREVNQYMLDILDCLTTDAMRYRDAEPLVRHGKYGLGKIQVQARVGKKRVPVWRVPILVELNVPLIVERINFKRAKEGLRKIKAAWVIWTSIKGLERDGFIVKVGTKRGMKGQLRAIGSFYVRQTLVAMPYDPEREIAIVRYGDAYFWGGGQPEVRERLARLEPVK